MCGTGVKPSMSVEVRIESEMEQTSFKPKENGDRTVEIEIPNTGITLDEVIEHKWVKDAYASPEDENKFHLYISAEKQQTVFMA